MNNFEGFLFVRELSFNYSGTQSNKLFMERVPNIKLFSLRGGQIIRLSGDFKHPSQTKLNMQGKLDIELRDDGGQISISPVSAEDLDPLFKTGSELEIRDFRLQPETKIQSLKFNSFASSLFFSLITNPSASTPASTMHLVLGNSPLKLSLRGYYLPDLGLEDTPISPNPLEDIILIPNIQALDLFFDKNIDFYLEADDEIKVASNQWFSQRFEVSNVEFSEQPNSSLQDYIPTSSIIEGKVIMSESELQVEDHQFLIYGEPGIKIVRSIEPSEDKGLAVRFSGKSRKIQVGLDPEFPVASIRSGWLARFFPQQALTVVTSLSTGILVSLL
jgi:hypothetical protein